MLYGKNTFIMAEVKATLLLDEIKKHPKHNEQDTRTRVDLVMGSRKEKSRKAKKSQRLVKVMPLLSQRSLQERFQAYKRVAEEKRVSYKGRHSSE